MKGRILYDIRNLAFDRLGEINHPHFTLTNDNAIRDTFYTPEVIEVYGTRMSLYSPNDAFIYHEFDIDIEGKSLDQIVEDLLKYSSSNVDYISTFLTFLWLTKDNSICIYSSLIMIPGLKGALVMSNIKDLVYTYNGKLKSTVFTEMEIRYAMGLYQKYYDFLLADNAHIAPIEAEFEIERNDKGQILSATENKTGNVKYSSYNCVERALHFLIIARKQRNPAFKIAFYVPILESLFTTDSSAVTHKVCERVALYLEDDVDKRKELYDFINDMYKTRSTFIHGQKFSDSDLDIVKLESEASRLDEIVRASLVLVMVCDYNIFTSLKPKGNSPKKTIEVRGDFLKYLMFGE